MFVICMICRSDKPGVTSEKYGDQWGVLGCHHVIHAHCFNKWCDTIKKEMMFAGEVPMVSCPACRTDLGSKPTVFKCLLSTLDREAEIEEIETLRTRVKSSFANQLTINPVRDTTDPSNPLDHNGHSYNGVTKSISVSDNSKSKETKYEQGGHDELGQLREEIAKLRNELEAVTVAFRKQQAPARIIAHFAKRIMGEAKGI